MRIYIYLLFIYLCDYMEPNKPENLWIMIGMFALSELVILNGTLADLKRKNKNQ